MGEWVYRSKIFFRFGVSRLFQSVQFLFCSRPTDRQIASRSSCSQSRRRSSFEFPSFLGAIAILNYVYNLRWRSWLATFSSDIAAVCRLCYLILFFLRGESALILRVSVFLPHPCSWYSFFCRRFSCTRRFLNDRTSSCRLSLSAVPLSHGGSSLCGQRPLVLGTYPDSGVVLSSGGGPPRPVLGPYAVSPSVLWPTTFLRLLCFRFPVHWGRLFLFQTKANITACILILLV
jgi:hypothetical protein